MLPEELTFAPPNPVGLRKSAQWQPQEAPVGDKSPKNTQKTTKQKTQAKTAAPKGAPTPKK
jgi:hypothetical protein